jgi:hypothetical protein
MKLAFLIANVCTESTRAAVFGLFAASAHTYKQINKKFKNKFYYERTWA